MFPLGTTAFEDKLYESFPDAILQMTSIKVRPRRLLSIIQPPRSPSFQVWVLTGNRGGTAINIGMSYPLIT